MTELVGRSVRGRLPYTPIHRRPALKLPNNARVAVWTIVNVENWSPTAAMPRAVLPPPMGQPLLPDVPNWAWHEYGMRVGYWRFIETLGSRNLKATFALNGSVCELYPEACEAARDAGWDFMGHGFVQKPYTVEINDVVISAVQQQPSDEILRRGRDHFDRLYLDGARAPRVMAISIHPYLTGVPHRIKYLEMLYDYILGHEGVVMWTGAEILDWYRSQVPA
jgi:hypothetical protein